MEESCNGDDGAVDGDAGGVVIPVVVVFCAVPFGMARTVSTGSSFVTTVSVDISSTTSSFSVPISTFCALSSSITLILSSKILLSSLSTPNNPSNSSTRLVFSSNSL